MSVRGRLSDRQDRLPAIVAVVGMLAAGVVVGPLAACGWLADQSAGAATVTADQVATARPSATSPTRIDAPAHLVPTPRASPPVPEPLVTLASEDAARRTGAGLGDVRVVQVEAREWPDRSLGCPRPGMGYAQAITPGFLIVVDAVGRRLEYHTDHSQVVLCDA